MSKSKRKNTAAKYWHELISSMRGKRDYYATRVKARKVLAKRAA